MRNLSAKSIAKPIRDFIFSESEGILHSIFNQSCNLLITDRLIGLVAPELGNSPYNIILDCADFENLEVGMSVKISDGKILIGSDLVIDLTLAEIWNPEILTDNFDWKIAAENLQELMKTMPALSKSIAIIPNLIQETEFLKLDPVIRRGDNYTQLSPRRMTGSRKLREICFFNLNEYKDEMEIHLAKKIENFSAELFSTNFSAENIAASVDSLIGLGSGLTPSGDDFLAGIAGIFHNFLRLNAAENKIQNITKILDQSIISALENSKTNLISAALLTAALQGWFAEKVSNFLLVLGDKNSSNLQKKNAMDQVLSIGHSSGHDMLAGICIAFMKLGKIGLCQN